MLNLRKYKISLESIVFFDRTSCLYLFSVNSKGCLFCLFIVSLRIPFSHKITHHPKPEMKNLEGCQKLSTNVKWNHASGIRCRKKLRVIDMSSWNLYYKVQIPRWQYWSNYTVFYCTTGLLEYWLCRWWMCLMCMCLSASSKHPALLLRNVNMPSLCFDFIDTCKWVTRQTKILVLRSHVMISLQLFFFLFRIESS